MLALAERIEFDVRHYMDQVLADTLTANLKAAKTPDAKLDALILAMIAVVDCQLKTAGRVKTMWEERNRVQWIGRVAFGFATGGGLAVTIKLMKATGML